MGLKKIIRKLEGFLDEMEDATMRANAAADAVEDLLAELAALDDDDEASPADGTDACPECGRAYEPAEDASEETSEDELDNSFST
jgi:hypothetical protein